MNNLTLAGEDFTYYETLGGGQGACPDADGPSAIHVAMSNTLNTPVEALETEFPLRVRELSLRRGSGGAGRHRGGDGIVREVEALAPMRYTLITERRRHARAAATAAATARPAATCSTASRCPPRPRASCPRDSAAESRRPAAAGESRYERQRSQFGDSAASSRMRLPWAGGPPGRGPRRQPASHRFNQPLQLELKCRSHSKNGP